MSSKSTYTFKCINCELMKHSDNNKKKSKSSISYEQLKQSVDDFDLKNGG